VQKQICGKKTFVSLPKSHQGEKKKRGYFGEKLPGVKTRDDHRRLKEGAQRKGRMAKEIRIEKRKLEGGGLLILL